MGRQSSNTYKTTEREDARSDDKRFTVESLSSPDAPPTRQPMAIASARQEQIEKDNVAPTNEPGEDTDPPDMTTTMDNKKASNGKETLTSQKRQFLTTTNREIVEDEDCLGLGGLVPEKAETAVPSVRAEQGSEKCDSIRSSDTESLKVSQLDFVEDESGLSTLDHSALARYLEVPPSHLAHVHLSLFRRALLDCYGRFLLNLPPSLLRDHVHLQFQIQEGHWWYEDFWYDAYPDKLPELSLKSFGMLICESFSILR